jgi:hypothetical protein
MSKPIIADEERLWGERGVQTLNVPEDTHSDTNTSFQGGTIDV